MTTPPVPRPPRSDALRNRRLLLSAASEAFAEHGTEVTVAEIARRAGVGKGTVFRHFPTKDDLVAAIMDELIGGLVANGRKLMDAADPAAALLEFMTSGIELLAGDRGLCETIGQPSLRHTAVQAGINRLCDVVEALTDRARRQGAIRLDITGQDVVLLLAGVRQITAPLDAAQPRLWRRHLALVFDGMRARDAPALPYPLPNRLAFTD